MKTIETTLTVASDRKATLQLPADVVPGEHRAVVVIDDITVDVSERPDMKWGRYSARPTNPHETFRREDLYGDDGR